MRTLSRMARDAARAETPSLWSVDARYGCLVKYNLPQPNAVVAPVAVQASPPHAAFRPPRASKPDDVAPAQSRTSSPPKHEGQRRSRGVPMSSRRSFSGTPRQSGKLDEPRRHARRGFRAESSRRADCALDNKTREGRLRVWGAGVDAKGSLRNLRKNCFMTTGTHAPRCTGRSRQDLGCPRFSSRHAPGRAIARTVRSWVIFDRPGTRASHDVCIGLFAFLPRRLMGTRFRRDRVSAFWRRFRAGEQV